MSKISNTNQEKTVLVTGATGGLGNAFVYEFCKMGYNLFLTGTNDVKLQNLKQELLKQFPSLNILTKSCDLSSLESRKEFTEYLIANNIQIRFLVNNAGFITEGKIKYASLDTLLKAIQVNCEGVVHLTKSVLDNKKPQDKLNIITVSSMAGRYPLPNMAIYAATKSMLTNFMLALRYEYRNDNVKVLVVEPGAIATSKEMQEAIKAQGLKGKLSSVKPEIIAKKAIKKSIKNKARYTPGFFNKLTNFASKLVSLSTQIKIAGKMWEKSQKIRGIK